MHYQKRRLRKLLPKLKEMAKQRTPAQIATDYEKKAKDTQSQLQKVIEKLYNDAINAVTPLAAAQVLPQGEFSLQGLPALQNRIDQVISQLTSSIEVYVENGMKLLWQLSNDKNDLIADIRIDKSLIPQGSRVVFYDTNAGALQSYLEAKEDGLNLSDRIYNSTAQFKAELETGLGLGISKGESAAELGRDLRQYLKEPDKLFRRVKDEEGNLQLSKTAKAFHPGQGVYRSSVKNIERLTVTATNNAYRSADTTRYKQMPFVLGYEWRRSANHKDCDLCDAMAGDYPVDFIFTGGHPFCICYLVPILMNNEQFAQYQKLVISGNDTPEAVSKIAKRITDIPESAQTYLKDNAEKISNLKNTPYFWANNLQYMPEVPQPE